MQGNHYSQVSGAESPIAWGSQYGDFGCSLDDVRDVDRPRKKSSFNPTQPKDPRTHSQSAEDGFSIVNCLIFVKNAIYEHTIGKIRAKYIDWLAEKTFACIEEINFVGNPPATAQIPPQAVALVDTPDPNVVAMLPNDSCADGVVGDSGAPQDARSFSPPPSGPPSPALTPSIITAGHSPIEYSVLELDPAADVPWGGLVNRDKSYSNLLDLGGSDTEGGEGRSSLGGSGGSVSSTSSDASRTATATNSCTISPIKGSHPGLPPSNVAVARKSLEEKLGALADVAEVSASEKSEKTAVSSSLPPDAPDSSAPLGAAVDAVLPPAADSLAKVAFVKTNKDLLCMISNLNRRIQDAGLAENSEAYQATQKYLNNIINRVRGCDLKAPPDIKDWAYVSKHIDAIVLKYELAKSEADARFNTDYLARVEEGKGWRAAYQQLHDAKLNLLSEDDQIKFNGSPSFREEMYKKWRADTSGFNVAEEKVKEFDRLERQYATRLATTDDLKAWQHKSFFAWQSLAFAELAPKLQAYLDSKWNAAFAQGYSIWGSVGVGLGEFALTENGISKNLRFEYATSLSEDDEFFIGRFTTKSVLSNTRVANVIPGISDSYAELNFTIHSGGHYKEWNDSQDHVTENFTEVVKEFISLPEIKKYSSRTDTLGVESNWLANKVFDSEAGQLAQTKETNRKETAEVNQRFNVLQGAIYEGDKDNIKKKQNATGTQAVEIVEDLSKTNLVPDSTFPSSSNAIASTSQLPTAKSAAQLASEKIKQIGDENSAKEKQAVQDIVIPEAGAFRAGVQKSVQSMTLNASYGIGAGLGVSRITNVFGVNGTVTVKREHTIVKGTHLTSYIKFLRNPLNKPSEKAVMEDQLRKQCQPFMRSLMSAWSGKAKGEQVMLTKMGVEVLQAAANKKMNDADFKQYLQENHLDLKLMGLRNANGKERLDLLKSKPNLTETTVNRSSGPVQDKYLHLAHDFDLYTNVQSRLEKQREKGQPESKQDLELSAEIRKRWGATDSTHLLHNMIAFNTCLLADLEKEGPKQGNGKLKKAIVNFDENFLMKPKFLPPDVEEADWRPQVQIKHEADYQTRDYEINLNGLISSLGSGIDGTAAVRFRERIHTNGERYYDFLDITLGAGVVGVAALFAQISTVLSVASTFMADPSMAEFGKALLESPIVASYLPSVSVGFDFGYARQFRFENPEGNGKGLAFFDFTRYTHIWTRDIKSTSLPGSVVRGFPVLPAVSITLGVGGSKSESNLVKNAEGRYKESYTGKSWNNWLLQFTHQCNLKKIKLNKEADQRVAAAVAQAQLADDTDEDAIASAITLANLDTLVNTPLDVELFDVNKKTLWEDVRVDQVEGFKELFKNQGLQHQLDRMSRIVKDGVTKKYGQEPTLNNKEVIAFQALRGSYEGSADAYSKDPSDANYKKCRVAMERMLYMYTAYWKIAKDTSVVHQPNVMFVRKVDGAALEMPIAGREKPAASKPVVPKPEYNPQDEVEVTHYYDYHGDAGHVGYFA